MRGRRRAVPSRDVHCRKQTRFWGVLLPGVDNRGADAAALADRTRRDRVEGGGDRGARQGGRRDSREAEYGDNSGQRGTECRVHSRVRKRNVANVLHYGKPFGGPRRAVSDEPRQDNAASAFVRNGPNPVGEFGHRSFEA